jgi:ferredoxin-NADP reductase
MRLVADQTFEYLPNMSFRGPDRLLVHWDSSMNPERRGPGMLARHTPFAIGAPRSKELARPVRVAAVAREADGIVRIRLEDPHGRDLPGWSPGAHIDVIVGGFVRKYSLCGDSADRKTLQIAVLREDAGRGGSACIHDTARAGDMIRIRGPKNYFRLDETADDVLLIAGGIGITPIIAMADRLKRLGKPYAIHYAGRSRRTMAFLGRLERDHGERLTIYSKEDGQRLNLDALAAGRGAGACIHACGPERMLAPLLALMAGQPERLRVEHFASTAAASDAREETGFDVELQDTRLLIHVARGQTLLRALLSVGVDVASDCEEGLCGSCEVHVLGGEIDHRDKVLSASERAGGARMMACCSRAKNGKLVVAL